MSRFLHVVAVQAAPIAWDLEATYNKFEAELRQLHRVLPGAQLFLFPELYLSAYGPFASSRPARYSPVAIAQAIPGPLTDQLGQLAAELGVWLVPGSIYERAGDGRIFNTALAFAPDGSLRARYRKVFPWRPHEDVESGDEFVVFDIESVGRVGVMICYDGWFPEVARQLAWLGAEIIVQPSATGSSDRDQELVLARANAIVNQLYLVNVNMGGRVGPGRSIVVDPEGRILSIAGDNEEYLSEVIDLAQTTRVRTTGTLGLSRVLTEILERKGTLALPLYGGALPTSARERRPT